MYSGLSLEEVSSSDVVANAVANELQAFWPMEREMLASILEMLHVLVLTTQSAHGGKNLPKPLHVQRPLEGVAQPVQRGSSAPSRPQGGNAPVISMSEFVSRDRRGDL